MIEQPNSAVSNFMRPETMLSTTVAGLLIAQFTDTLTNVPSIAAAVHPFVIGLVLSFLIASAIVWQAEKLNGMVFVYWLVGAIALFNAATGSFAAKQAAFPTSAPATLTTSAPPAATSWLPSVAAAYADDAPAQKPWFPPAEPTPRGE